MEECPHKFYLQHLAKVKSPEQPAVLQIGDVLAKAIEAFILEFKRRKDRPSEAESLAILSPFIENSVPAIEPDSRRFVVKCFWQFSRVFDPMDEDCQETDLSRIRFFPEFQVCIDRDFRLVDWWYPQAFFRLKIDFVSFFAVGDSFVCSLTDYKAGNTLLGVDQTCLYAALLDRVFGFPVTEYRGRIFHLYSMTEERQVFSLGGVRSFWNSFSSKIAAMSKRDALPADPSVVKCGKCQFRLICKESLSPKEPLQDEISPSTPS